jgi:hypothetical protein
MFARCDVRDHSLIRWGGCRLEDDMVTSDPQQLAALLIYKYSELLKRRRREVIRCVRHHPPPITLLDKVSP